MDFADHVVLLLRDEEDLHYNLNAWKDALQRRNMLINIKKSKTMVAARGRREIVLKVGHESVEQASHFKYAIILDDARIKAIMYVMEIFHHISSHQILY